jgi:hypothetical protein
MAYEQVELASVPFTTFIANKNRKGDPASYSPVLRGYVRHWLGQVWNEYERIKLKEIVSGIGSDGNVDGDGQSLELGSLETENPALQRAS